MPIRYLPHTRFGRAKRKKSGGGFSAEYQAVYDSLTTKPSAAIAASQNTMVESLVSAGIWTKLDFFYVFAQTVNTDGEAMKNWVNPASNDSTLVNAPAFVALEGLTGNGTNSYVNSNYNPATDASKMSLNDTAYGIYIRTNVNEAKSDMGVSVGTNHALYFSIRYSDALYTRVNSVSFTTYANTDSRGYYVSSRSASNVIKSYKNAVEKTDETDPSTLIPSGDVYILGVNDDGSPALLGTKQASIAHGGSSLDQTEVTACKNAIETYMDSNGKGIIT